MKGFIEMLKDKLFMKSIASIFVSGLLIKICLHITEGYMYTGTTL